ncbi:hypothetical protein FQR65_LT14591 [Abscondita terminalis]|nr:hypothetical protein FQR65_LT14591 [Abscondita terminalis]
MLQRVLVAYCTRRYAGHSKWANIKHTKMMKDAERSRLFTKLSQQIKVAVHEGGSTNPLTNFKLDHIINQARRANMPMQTIESVIKSTQKDKALYKSYTFEIKGPASSIILCEVCSPNVLKTKNDIATIIRKHSMKYADGGGRHLFDYKGTIEAEVHENDTDDTILENATNAAIECDADDVTFQDDVLLFTCNSHSFMKVQKHLELKGYKILTANLEYIPIRRVPLNDADVELCSKLYEKLKTIDEVVALYDNIA